jgi:hypothetical protein
MSQLFLQHPEYLVPVAAIVCGSVVALVAVILSQWRHVRQADLEASLKRDMLERGLGVDEIERVLRASSTPAPAPAASSGPISDNEYYLVEKLVDEGKSADEIERVLRVFRSVEGGRPSSPSPGPEASVLVRPSGVG